MRCIHADLRPAAACCAAVLLCACSAKVEPSYEDPTPVARLEAIRQTNAQASSADIPHLIENLASDDPVVRMAAIGALERLTGTTLGYRFDATLRTRTEEIEAWKQWLASNPVAAPTAAP